MTNDDTVQNTGQLVGNNPDEVFTPSAVYVATEDTIYVVMTQDNFIELDVNGVSESVWFRYIHDAAPQGEHCCIGMRVVLAPLGLSLEKEMPLLDFFNDLVSGDPRIRHPEGFRDQLKKLNLTIEMK